MKKGIIRMHETTAVFLGIIIGVFLVLFCCAILFVYTKITKRIDNFKETERKAYTKARDRAEEKYKELDERIKELEKSRSSKNLTEKRKSPMRSSDVRLKSSKRREFRLASGATATAFLLKGIQNK